jgi:hypothetical protein
VFSNYLEFWTMGKVRNPVNLTEINTDILFLFENGWCRLGDRGEGAGVS